ncbi:MAG: ribonuclease J [Acidimicrobiales bacterium mtb01]|nr:ribonuclease J [Actinomycetota bacterium]TEX45448.1 MAG: ribonuclease J [Acidimicrobiales bacterium mtb01]
MPAPVRVVFLGGLGEIGRNCMAIEQDDSILLIDCGLMFPNADMHGIDLVLPDFTWLRENADRIVGCVATHGHEDHVGGLQFLLRDVSFPVFGSAVTLGLARGRIEEAGLLGATELVTVADNERRMIGPFDVEFIPVTHSVPHAFAVAVHTPQGVILHSGDFKLDLTPVDGRRTDLSRIGAIAAGPGVRLLMCDSTNAEERGHAPSEKTVGAVLRALFHEHRDRRIITASFASHIHRVQQIIDAAVETDRKVATLGRSMQKNVRMARDLGVLTVPDESLIDIEQIDDYPPGRVCVISTGSQGEPMSALSLLARGDNKWLKVGDQDTVILSSHAIPGNEFNVTRVIDGLLRAGADVVHSGLVDVHATGHAQADELKTYYSIVKPEWFVPVHGEYRHLVANARLGELMGIPRSNVLMCEDGDVVELSDDGLNLAGRVPAGYLYVDGIVGDVSHGVLRDRRVLAEEGVVVVVVTVDVESGKVLTGPEIITRGWVYAPEAEDLLDEACDTVAAAVEKALAEGVRDPEGLERDVRRAAGRFVNERTKRRPMIVPVVMEA